MVSGIIFQGEGQLSTPCGQDRLAFSKRGGATCCSPLNLLILLVQGNTAMPTKEVKEFNLWRFFKGRLSQLENAAPQEAALATPNAHIADRRPNSSRGLVLNLPSLGGSGAENCHWWIIPNKGTTCLMKPRAKHDQTCIKEH